MSFKLFLLVATLGSLLAGCVSTSGSDSLQQMERNHRLALETAG
jgi:hypothetical protein